MELLRLRVNNYLLNQTYLNGTSTPLGLTGSTLNNVVCADHLYDRHELATSFYLRSFLTNLTFLFYFTFSQKKFAGKRTSRSQLKNPFPIISYRKRLVSDYE